MRWQPWDVIGGAYSDDTRPWSVQDTVNYLVVMAEKGGTRSPKMLRGVPGMVTFSASMPESPVRGLYVAEGRLFAVVAQTLYAIGTGGAATSLGTIPGVGRCVMTHNQVSGGNQIVVANGQSGYVYDTTDGTLAQITDDGFPGFRSVDFIDQYIIGVEPFGRYWFHSDLSDAKSYSMLDRSEAEKAPDRIQQAIATGPDVFVLGERTGQFFANTGEATGTFQNRAGTELDIGAASPWSACRLDNTVYWLGNDGCVYRLAGYQAQRISTHAMEQAISRATIADAYAFTFEDHGHKCYLLTLPDGQTWCFDAASNEWTRRESYGLNRWRVSALVRWGRNWIAGDYVNGKLYQLDWRVQQEAGEPLERRRVTGVLHDDQNRMIVNALELAFDTGMDEDSPPLPQSIVPALSITGDLPDGAVGESGSYQYTLAGGVTPRTTAILSGSLPPGASLNTAGVVVYTYTTEGSYSWVVRVTDSEGNTADLADSAVIAASASKLWVGVSETAASVNPTGHSLTLGAVTATGTTGETTFTRRMQNFGWMNADSLTLAERLFLFNEGQGVTWAELQASASPLATSITSKLTSFWPLDAAGTVGEDKLAANTLSPVDGTGAAVTITSAAGVRGTDTCAKFEADANTTAAKRLICASNDSQQPSSEWCIFGWHYQEDGTNSPSTLVSKWNAVNAPAMSYQLQLTAGDGVSDNSSRIASYATAFDYAGTIAETPNSSLQDFPAIGVWVFTVAWRDPLTGLLHIESRSL